MTSLQYFDQKSVFLTGATGFLGKVFLEKLLRLKIDSLTRVYVLIRAKKVKQRNADGTSIESLRQVDERLRLEIFESPIFDRLKEERGADVFARQFNEKVCAVSGQLGASVALFVFFVDFFSIFITI